MPLRIDSKKNKRYRPLHLREWRKSRGLTQERLVERIQERIPEFSTASLSRLENGKQPYTQPVLEVLAWALQCEPQDLIMRKPDSEIWSIMDTLEKLSPEERAQLTAIAQTFLRTES
jgi:transcriptional regulator with XRE-family HTH domain